MVEVRRESFISTSLERPLRDEDVLILTLPPVSNSTQCSILSFPLPLFLPLPLPLLASHNPICTIPVLPLLFPLCLPFLSRSCRSLSFCSLVFFGPFPFCLTFPLRLPLSFPIFCSCSSQSRSLCSESCRSITVRSDGLADS